MALKKFNIADYFSLYRFIAVPAIVLCIILEAKIWTSALLLVSFITDAIDGYLARKRRIETSRGAKLDSYGDLITLVSALAAFIVFETEYFIDHLPIVITAASLFIFQLLLAVLKFKQISSYHTYLAKITAILIAILFVVTPVTGPIDIMFYAAFYAGIAEAIEEILITLVLPKPQQNVKGLYWILKRQDFKLDVK